MPTETESGLTSRDIQDDNVARLTDSPRTLKPSVGNVVYVHVICVLFSPIVVYGHA